MFRASDVRATLTLSVENSENLDDMLLLQTLTGLEEKAEREELAKTISEASPTNVSIHPLTGLVDNGLPFFIAGFHGNSELSCLPRAEDCCCGACGFGEFLQQPWWLTNIQTKTKQKTLQRKSSRTRKYCLRIKHKPKYWFPEPMSDWSLQTSF